MKKLFFGLLFIGTFSTGVAAEIAPDCTYQGIRLYGRVKVVDFMPDFYVQRVDFMPDLRVQETVFEGNSCGEWKFVDSMPDFTIQYVDFMPDFTIQFVHFMPGL